MLAGLLKQFVPSAFCLQCKGCCRFSDAHSRWRPKLGTGDRLDLAALMPLDEVIDHEGYITAIRQCGQHFCRFLNGADSTCGVYAKRPFECALYPFILTQTAHGIKVYVHLACPFVQDHLDQQVYKDYLAYLKEFFSEAEIKAFLKYNAAMLHDYTPQMLELLYLFDIGD